MFLKQNKKERKKIDKNQIYIYILTFLIFFWSIASVLGCIGYARTKNTSHNTIKASAETLEEWQEGQFIIELPAITGTTFIGDTFVCSLAYNYRLILNQREAFFSVVENTELSEGYTDSFLLTEGLIDTLPTHANVSGSFDCQFTLIEFSATVGAPYFRNLSSAHMSTYVRLFNKYTAEFIYNIYLTYIDGVQNIITLEFKLNIIGRSDSVRGVMIPQGYGYSSSPNGVLYYDADAPILGVDIATFSDIYKKYKDLQGGTAGNYQTGYADGYRVGKSEGVQSGFENGFNEGREQGYANGRAEGYQEGMEESNQYTFFNLITAVVDAPIQAFTGLFNFDILGVNLASFFLGLLTVGVCLAVLRLIF